MNPYHQLPSRNFWRPAVAERHMFDIADLWAPKFPITRKNLIATYGSCFAQHIGRALENDGWRWMSAEPAPAGLSDENARKYGYGIFSSRTENIYTATMLAQWVDWALERTPFPEEVWERDGRWFDPFRPSVEPDGFASREELEASRLHTARCFRHSFEKSDVLVFTLGLTERWINIRDGHEYAICPGTAAGTFDAALHGFAPLRFDAIVEALSRATSRMRSVNPALKVLLTVSPVPLVATNTARHVLVATMESKSILRAVAGQMAADKPFVDYFPSYEIINAPVFRGAFFDPNLRNVNAAGVAHVMKQFFAGLLGTGAAAEPEAPARVEGPRNRAVRAGVAGKAGRKGGGKGQGKGRGRGKSNRAAGKSADVVCEEEILGAFAPK